jgi:hypothetical protein
MKVCILSALIVTIHSTEIVTPKQPIIDDIGKIIQIVEQNRHEDVVLENGAGNARTKSGQRAYHRSSSRIVSHNEMVRAYYVTSHFVASSRMSKRRNRYPNVR